MISYLEYKVTYKFTDSATILRWLFVAALFVQSNLLFSKMIQIEKMRNAKDSIIIIPSEYLYDSKRSS